MPETLQAGLAAFEIALSEPQLKCQLRFLDELLRWNRQVNLTAVRDKSEAVEKHLIDSLVLLKFLPESGRLLDMGSGGGLPGIPLAIASPELKICSVDSVGKKINFQKHVKRLLQLVNFQPLHTRLEELDRHLAAADRFEFVVARAFSSFDTLLTFAGRWLHPDGRLLAMKGPEGWAEWQAAAATDFRLVSVENYRLPWSKAERQLFILKKALPRELDMPI